jgi:negative regulator of flagellin synthesis FlgM
MKIGPLEPKVPANTVAGERKANGPSANPQAGPSAHVELSSTASLLDAGAADGTFDAEKVARLAQAIKDGKFQVNPEVIADKLIANAQELLPKAPH